MDRLKIDQVAAQSGLTKRTIRYYEQIGILPPPPRSEGGIRYYTREHVDLLKKITNAKEALGFTLQELQHFVSLSDIIEDRRADYKQLSDPTARKEKLEEIVNTINDSLQLIEQKVGKIEDVRSELLELRKRALAIVQTLDMERGAE